MIFSFIKYVRPAWTFNLVPGVSEFSSVYYHPELAPLADNSKVELDNRYESNAAKWGDVGFHAIHKGNMSMISHKNYEAIAALGKPTLNDEYTFVTKYWGNKWTAYILFVRLLSLKNPFKEIKAYSRSLKTPRKGLYEKEFVHTRFNNFTYPAAMSQQKVSVVIPTLNRYTYLKDVMEDLEKQDHKNFDVIVVDQSEPCDREFYKQFKLDIKLVEQKEKLLWTARNHAIKISDADFLLFFDDDSRVKPDWITNHLKCIYAYDCDVSAGVSLSSYEKIQDSYKLFRWADQFDSGNSLVKRDVLEKVGLFDEQFNKQRMGDGEFGFRIYLNGVKSVSNPLADRLHLKAGEGGLRQMGSWDGFRPKKMTAPRPIPSVLYMYRKYFKPVNVFFILFLAIPRSVIPYQYRKDKVKMALGTAGAFLIFPYVMFQVYRSWKIAGRMLREGDKIPRLGNKK